MRLDAVTTITTRLVNMHYFAMESVKTASIQIVIFIPITIGLFWTWFREKPFGIKYQKLT